MNFLEILGFLFLSVILVALFIFLREVERAVLVDDDCNEIKEEDNGTEEGNKDSD